MLTASTLSPKYNIPQDASKELERTPAAAAVSLYEEESRGNPGSLVASVVGQTAGAQGTESPGPYLDAIANSPHRHKTACPSFFVPGHCDNGHEFFRMTFCGREWCPSCRDQMHGRRISRWLPKVQQIAELGYLVVTIPPEDRCRFRTKRELARAGKLATAVVRRTWARGLRRWHWFGDSGQGYHPHLNYLVEGGHVSRAQLRSLRRELASVLGLTRLPVVNYQYTRKPGQMWHHLSYVTRATFLDRAWDETLATELHGFRNVSWWGSWKGEAAWSLDDLGGDRQGEDDTPAPGELVTIGKLEDGKCPICGLPVRWGRAVHVDYLPGDLVDVGQGYYMGQGP